MRCVQIESDVNESYTAICFCELPARRHRLHFVPLFIEVKMYKVILRPSRRFISGHNGSFSLWLLWLPSHQIRCRAQVGGVIVACAFTSLPSHNRYFSLAEVWGITEEGGERCVSMCVWDNDDAWNGIRRGDRLLFKHLVHHRVMMVACLETERLLLN